MAMFRTRWAALGAAVAITLGAAGVGVSATVSSGAKPVFVPIDACRLADTRPNFQVGPRDTPLGTADVHTVTAHGTNGECTIPSDALALSLNVTAIGATQATFLTIWATGEPMPNASSLNPAPGQPPTPNAVTTRLSAGGQLDIYNLQGEVHVLVDVNGYFADHVHDDRYYTKDEADAAFVSSRPGEIHISAFEMDARADGTTWGLEPDSWWHNSATTNSECLVSPVDLPAGTDVTELSVVYFMPFVPPSGTPELFVHLVGARDDVGSKATVTHEITRISVPAPLTPSAASERLDVNVNGQPEVRDGHSYALFLCAREVIEIFGADIAVS